MAKLFIKSFSYIRLYLKLLKHISNNTLTQLIIIILFKYM